ncbi:MAG: Uma2 family endonuclease [Bryobacteraceae bacterium]|jgi:Uma2 family endonuclease
MATSTSVPVEEYLRTTYHPDMDYVDGELVERHVGERRHSRLQILCVLLLGPRERERGFHVFTEQRLRVLGTKHRYRIPDVCVMALPYRSEPVLTTPPHLAIEILSPEDETADILAKVADFLRFGIPHIWIVDPYKRTLQEADREGIRYRTDLVVETELVGRIDFKELFSQLEEPTE